MNLNSFYGHWTFLPVTDNSFLTTLPSIALANKRVNGENILVGNNANEGALFVPPSINTIDALENWLHDAFPTFSDVDIQAVLTAYPSSNLPVNPSDTTFETPGTGPATAINISSLATGQQQRANNIYAEATFVCPSYWLNDAFTTQNRKSYHYQYSVPSGQHGDDVTAFFGPAKPNQPPAFTAVFRHIWGNFSVAASPARAVEYWPTWVEGSMSQLLNLNTTGGTPYVVPTITGGNVTQFMEPGVQNAISVANAKTWEGGRGARCDFWARIAEQVPT
jgi:carboxylesterase type B